MRIKGFQQLKGGWIPFERKVGIAEYLRHLYYG